MKKEKEITKMPVPPAYKNVKYTDDPNDKIYATGVDKKGRKQVIYNKWYIEENKNKRFKKILENKDVFKKILDKCEKIVATSRAKFNTESHICLMILLIIKCNFRIGNEKYYKLYKSYGVSTLEWRHVKISKKDRTFEIKFIGKKGVENCSKRNDELIYNYLRRLQKKAKENLNFKKTDRVFDVSSSAINDYIKQFGDITAKDLRTFNANYLYITFYLENKDNEKDDKKRKMNALKKVAEELHNTPAVCKSNYLVPGII